MSNVVNQLQSWFKSLSRDDQEDIVEFLYDGKMLIKEGMYVGPHPNVVNKGLYCGPLPQVKIRICPTCGKPI